MTCCIACQAPIGRNKTKQIAPYKWEVKHAEMRSKLKVKGRLYTETHMCRGLAWNARTREAVDLIWAQAQEDGQEVRCYDVTQNCWRKRSKGAENLPTMTTGSCLFLFHKDRILTIRESYKLLGWHEDVVLSSLSDTALKDLLGDSMSVPTVTTVLVALLAGVLVQRENSK